MPAPLAYFITFTTYGTWLHGRDPGSVDRQHNTPETPFLPVNPDVEESRRQAMRQEPYLLDEARRGVVLRTIHEVAKHRRWVLWAVHVRTNHIHIVVTASPDNTRPKTARPKSIRAESVSAGIPIAQNARPQSISAGLPHPIAPKPEKVMNDFKAWASRRLREAFNEPMDRERWTRHGSTRWLNTQVSLQKAIAYVVDEQGEPMACFDGRNNTPKP